MSIGSDFRLLLLLLMVLVIIIKCFVAEVYLFCGVQVYWDSVGCEAKKRSDLQSSSEVRYVSERQIR